MQKFGLKIPKINQDGVNSPRNKLKTFAKILLATYPILLCQADTANSVSAVFW